MACQLEAPGRIVGMHASKQKLTTVFFVRLCVGGTIEAQQQTSKLTARLRMRLLGGTFRPQKRQKSIANTQTHRAGEVCRRKR